MKMSRKRVKYARPSVLNRTHSLIVKDVQDVQSFVFFVGYPRSSHSISLLVYDWCSSQRHPNCPWIQPIPTITQERYSPHLQMSLYNALYIRTVTSSQLTAGVVWTSPFKAKAIISDSLLARSLQTIELSVTSQVVSRQDYRDMFTTLYTCNRLSDLVKVPIKVIHVVRNPYDMLSQLD